MKVRVVAFATHALGPRDLDGLEQPSLALSVETDELQIPAGLQDRVAQVYEGVTYMDFRHDLMEQAGHGLVGLSYGGWMTAQAALAMPDLLERIERYGPEIDPEILATSAVRVTRASS